MRHALCAEWTKLRTAPAARWSLLGLVAATAATSAIVSAASGAVTDTTALALSGVYVAQVVVVAFAASTVAGEHETGLARVTLLACPRRSVVYCARAAVLTAAVLLAGLPGLACAFAAGRLLLPAGSHRASGGAATMRAVLGTDLYLGLLALMAIGAATALRHTAAVTGAILGLLFLPPLVVLAAPFPGHISRAIERYSPMTAGLAIRATGGASPIGPWPGLAVCAAYSGAALLAGLCLFQARDA